MSVKNGIIAFIIGAVLCFLLLEGTVRLVGIAPPVVRGFGNNITDPYLPYRPKPLSVSADRGTTDEFDYEYRHNSAGFRDIEHDIEKKEGVFRILGLGDSFTYGAGAALEDTYLYQLETMLNSDGGATVEIIKAGIPRYFPEIQRVLLEHYGIPYSPDLIIVGFLPNDVIDTYFGTDAVVVSKTGNLKTSVASELGSTGEWLYHHSHVLRIILRRYVDYRLAQKYDVQWDDIYKKDGAHEKDWQKIESEYTKIVDIANSIGAKVIVCHIPQKPPWTDADGYPAARLAAWAEANGAGFVDVLPAMIEKNSEGVLLYYPKDGHCTPEGYTVVATTLYRYLVQLGIVP